MKFVLPKERAVSQTPFFFQIHVYCAEKNLYQRDDSDILYLNENKLNSSTQYFFKGFVKMNYNISNLAHMNFF